MLDPKFFDELRNRIDAALRDSPAQDLERNLRALLADWFSRLDLVLREDSLGGVLTLAYDDADRLTSMQHGGGGQTPVRVDYAYTDRDEVETLTLFDPLTGQVLQRAPAVRIHGHHLLQVLDRGRELVQV